MIKNKEYWIANTLYGWVMSQTLPGNDFKRFEDIFELNED